MPLTTVAAATGILTNAMKALDSLREQAKGSKDSALKENISKLYDNLLDLKAAVIRVVEENSELRRIMAEQASAASNTPQPEIQQVGFANYYFVGDKGPYCQVCYDRDKKLVMVTPQASYTTGVGRRCEVCNKTFVEAKHPPQPRRQVRISPYS